MMYYIYLQILYLEFFVVHSCKYNTFCNVTARIDVFEILCTNSNLICLFVWMMLVCKWSTLKGGVCGMQSVSCFWSWASKILCVGVVTDSVFTLEAFTDLGSLGPESMSVLHNSVLLQCHDMSGYFKIINWSIYLQALYYLYLLLPVMTKDSLLACAIYKNINIWLGKCA